MRKRSLSLHQASDNLNVNKLEGVFDCDEEDFELKVDDDYNEIEEEEASHENNSCAEVNLTETQREVDIEFIKVLKLAAKDKDTCSYKSTLRKLNLNKIDGLKNMHKNELRTKFNTLLKSIGKYRTFYSVVHDMEKFYTKKLKYPEKPIAPPTPQVIYLKELLANGEYSSNENVFKWSAEMYNKLPIRKKSIYIESHNIMKEEYTRQLKQFYKKNPTARPQTPKLKITPFNLYFDELNSAGTNCKRRAALKLWNNLSVKIKVSYIKKAYQYQQNDPSDNKTVMISNKDKLLLEEHNGKPEKPPLSVYRLYLQNKDKQPSYKSLTKEAKEALQNNLNGLIQKYKEDMTNYIKQLKGDVKKAAQKELSQFVSKYKLPETSNENLNVPNTRLKRRNSTVQYTDTDDDASEKRPSKKKRKMSVESEVISEVTKPTYQKSVNKRRKTQTKEITKKHNDNKKSNTKVNEFREIEPPRTVFKYFVSINSFDSLETARNKYRNLSIPKKRKIKKTHKAACETYIRKLREYLSTLNESEIKPFVRKMGKTKGSDGDFNDDEMDSSGDELLNNDSG